MNTFNKSIFHSTVNSILNKGLSKPLRIINTFPLTDVHEVKRKIFAEYIISN